MVPLNTEPGKVIMPSTTTCQQPLPKQIASFIDERDLDRNAPNRTTDAPIKRSAALEITHLLCSEEPTTATPPYGSASSADGNDESIESGLTGSSGSYHHTSTADERDTVYRLGFDSLKPSLHLPSIGRSSPHAQRRELPSIRTLDSMPNFGSRQNQDRVAPSSQAAALDSCFKSWSQQQQHYETQPTIPTRTSAFQPFVAASRREHHSTHPHATDPITLAAAQHEAVPLRRSSYDASQARYNAYGPSPSRASSSLCMERCRSGSPISADRGHERYRDDTYHHQHHASSSPYASSSHYASQNAYGHTYAGGYAQPGTYQQQQVGSYAPYPGVSYHDPSNPNGPPMIKAKRKRANAGQLKVLNQVFQQTFFPSTELRIHLGKQLGMSPRTVQIWFQNKRQSWRSKTRAAAAAVAREENKQQEQQSRDAIGSKAADGGDDDDKKTIEAAAESDTEIASVAGHASRRSSSSSVASALADEIKPSTPACSSPTRSPTADSSSTVSPVSPSTTQTDYFQERSSLKSCYGQCSSYDYRYPHPSGSAFQHNHSRHQLLHHNSLPPSSSFGYHQPAI